jgi:hypothetical protein
METRTLYQTNGRQSITREIGSTGLDEWGGYVNEDFLAEWATLTKRVEAVEEMLHNSPVIGGLRLSVEMPIRDIEWQFVSDEGEDDPRLDLLNDAWANMSHSWNDHVIESLLFAFYGFSLFTINYERVDGRVLWRKFKQLGHDSIQNWLFADDGGLEGVQQYPHLWREPIPIERMLLYRFRKVKNNPEGESILRPAWVPFYYIKNIQHIEAIGIERNLAGLPVVTMGEGTDPDESGNDYKRADKIARNIRMDEQGGIVIPGTPAGMEPWKVELLSSTSTRVMDTDTVISRYEKRMLMTALAQFLMLGMDDVGAMATSENATDFHAMLLNATADILGETFTKFAIPRLMRLNGQDEDGLKLTHSPAGDLDVIGFADVLSKTGTFLTWTDEDEVDLRARLRMAEKTAEQLAEEREAKAAENPLAGLMQQPPQNGNEPVEADESGVQLFAANNAPDDDERRRLERRWTRTARDFFEGQYERVIRGAKRAR